MDILIKSFNRPYYLDRCIQSIYRNCSGLEFNIKILDDGTPQKYLDKLQRSFPETMIYKSGYYDEKVKCTSVGKTPAITAIPIDLWVEIAQKSSDYFILLEDDMWFTEKVDLQELLFSTQKNGIQFVKLFWLGNPKLIQKKTIKIANKITVYKPDLFIRNPFLYYCIFYKLDRFGIRKMLRFFKINTLDRLLAYYSIYAVAGILFHKNYFLQLWSNHNNDVNEGLQLYNAVKFYNRNKEMFFAHTNNEVMKTGFSSSATSQNKNGVLIDMFAFNLMLNEAWFTNKFDAINNYPNDFDETVIYAIIGHQNKLVSNEKWSIWKREFRNQYESFGCKLE
ncbi:hypothetical protein ACNQGB_12245 [Flavobacterium sp. XS1P32]|uniref:hypothetical protein n=1 Tax=Flavobacterium sp. XS1P32 TaxID=3401726 RepID=UPI003AADDB1A